jgi:hypothetical protein
VQAQPEWPKRVLAAIGNGITYLGNLWWASEVAAIRDLGLEQQQEAQLEGLAIGLDQRGEKSAAHLIRRAVQDLRVLRHS